MIFRYNINMEKINEFEILFFSSLKHKRNKEK